MVNHCLAAGQAKLRHATGAGDVAKRGSQLGPIAVGKHLAQVFGDVFVRAKVVGHVERPGFYDAGVYCVVAMVEDSYCALRNRM
jgi:hypothetical protein